jgi:hypothetical protein
MDFGAAQEWDGFWWGSRMDFGAAQEWTLVELKNGILVWSSGMDFGDFGVELRNGILVELSLKLRSNPVGGGGGGGGDSSAMVYDGTNGIQCRVKTLA